MHFWLEDEIKGYYKRKHLPHYDNDKVFQFITYRLFDSVPKNLLYRWMEQLEMDGNIEKGSEKYIALERKIHGYEDSGYGECYLKNPLIYNIVKEAFEQFDQVRYELVDWVIMPNHVHVLISPKLGYSLPKIVQSWKAYTARQANKVLGRQGQFWMKDYFDRYIRSEEHLCKVIAYIDKNRESLKR